jgi:UDP-N-acetylglucosamine transferase subunit ALG13
VILVTTGTNAPPFDRLLREVERLRAYGSVVVQHGPSQIRPPGAKCVDYLPFREFSELVRAADVVVTHAGVGSVLISVMNGKRPIVVPRRAHFGEHVDDHQLELARRLAEIDVVTLVDDPAALPAAVAAHTSFPVSASAERTSRLVEDLRRYLTSVVGRPSVPPAERTRPDTVRTH